MARVGRNGRRDLQRERLESPPPEARLQPGGTQSQAEEVSRGQAVFEGFDAEAAAAKATRLRAKSRGEQHGQRLQGQSSLLENDEGNPSRRADRAPGRGRAGGVAQLAVSTPPAAVCGA